MKPCPYCHTPHGSRQHRRSAMDWLASWAGYYPYQCQKCQRVFRAASDTARRRQVLWSTWVACPRCGSDRPQRISSVKVTPTWENYLWRHMGLPGYRCPDCRKRFIDVRRVRKARHQELQNLEPEPGAREFDSNERNVNES